MVTGVNSNVNLTAMYKLAAKSNVTAGKNVSRPVDTVMTANGSIFKSKASLNSTPTLSNFQTALNSLKSVKFGSADIAKVSKMETRLNEINLTNIPNTSLNLSNASVQTTKLSSIRSSSNKRINTLNSKSLYNKVKTTSNMGAVMRNTVRRMQNNPITAASGNAAAQKLSAEDIVAQVQQRRQNVKYFFDQSSGKSYRISALSCISTGQALMNKGNNHKFNFSKLYRFARAH